MKHYEVMMSFGISDVLEFDDYEEAEKAAKDWHERTKMPIDIVEIESKLIKRVS